MRSDLYTRLYLYLSAHRRMVLTVTAVVVVVCAVISSRIDLEEDILAMLPQHDQLVDEYRYAIRKFHQVDRIYIDVGINADDAETLAHAADEVFSALSTNAAYEQIRYRIEPGSQQKVIEFLTGALPNLFTDADALALEPKLQPAAVRDYLTAMRRKLSGPEGVVLKDIVAADPVGMSSLVTAKVLPLQTGFGEAQIVDGRITSADGRHILLMAEPKFPSANSRESVALVKDLLRVAHEVDHKFPGVHVAVTGGHRMSVDNSTIIKTDALRCITLGMGAMLILCLTAYRRRWLALVAFLPSLFGTLMAGVVLALWQPHLSAIATGFGSIAVGITVDYAIHVIYHLDDAASPDRTSVGRHLSGLVFPIGIGAVTTIAAFLVMARSPLHGYQQLGIFGAIGVAFSVAFALVILPLLVPMARQSGQPPLWLTRWLEAYLNWQSRRRIWLAIFVIVITAATSLGIRRLAFEGDISKLNGITESTRRDDALITGIWGGALGMTLVVARAATPDEALAQNDRTAGILARDPNVSAVYSLASACPSKFTQEMNIERWREFWTAARRRALQQTLQQIGAELGFRDNAFARFWNIIDGKPSLLSLDTFRGTPLEQVLSERVALAAGNRIAGTPPGVSDSGTARRSGPERETDDNAVSTLVKLKDRSSVAGLRAALPSMIVLDHQAFAKHIAGMARSGMELFAAWSGLVVAAILYVTLASTELVAITLLPLAFGLLWTFGAMGWLGVPIDLMNSVFVIFIIGVGEDYSVFLVASKLDQWRGREPRIAVTSASVLISALTTIFGFGVLVLANHPVLYSMGTTVLLGMAFAFVATLVVTPLGMDLLLFKDPPRGAPRWWHLLGTLWVAIHLGGSELFLYYVLRPLLKLFSPRTATDRLRRATRWMARGVVKGLPFGKLEFQNISAATFESPCIVISNHQSAVDVMLMVSLPGDVRQTAKKRVFDNPMLGVGCKLLGHVMVEPNDPETTLHRCRDKLAEGASVHFYPEGTRSPDGFVKRFHRGAFELAVELRQEILPVILCDTWTAMPRDAYWFEPYHVTVRALPRVTPRTFDYSLGSQALMRHCETLVRDGLQRQLDAINTPRVLRRKVERLYRYQGKFVEQFVHWKMKTDPVFVSLDQVVPRQGFILDLGCGYGVATHWLAHCTDQRTFLGVDYDEDKIRVARRTAPQHERIEFRFANLLQWEYPECDAALLLDVLHYWTPEKQQLILTQVRRALRSGGHLVLRDAARADNAAHGSVKRWETLATRFGHNKTEEGLHFQTLAQLEDMLRRAGFVHWEIKQAGGRDSNILIVARTAER